MLEILESPSAELILACKDDEQTNMLAGYLILEAPTHFKAAYTDPSDGLLDPFFVINPSLTLYPSTNSHNLLELLENPELRYIYQIAVRTDLRRQGVGTALINMSKQRSTYALLADTLFSPEPYDNEASFQLFRRNGFKQSGTLDIRNFPVFQPCQTRVLTWMAE